MGESRVRSRVVTYAMESGSFQDFAVDKLELDWLQRAQKKPSLVLGCSTNESLQRLLSDILQ